MPNNKTFRVSLDMKAPTAQRNEWEVVEGDNGNIIEITLTDDGEPVDLSGCKVLAVFGLPTGVTVEQDTDEGSVTISGTDHNIITIALKTGSFSPGRSSSGLMKCEIQVYSGVPQNTLITSAQFTFRCRRAIMNDDTIAATDEYPVLVELIEEVQGLILGSQSDWDEDDPADPAYIKNKPTDFPVGPHASTHATDGTDPISPDSIGAMAANATPTPAAHATSHASDGADPVTPAAIGAIATSAKGAASGVASLNSSKKVTATQASSKIVSVTANKTLASSDAGCMLMVDSLSDLTITLPANANVSLAVGTEVEVMRYGTGAVTFEPATDVTLLSAGGADTIADQYGCACLKKVDTNEWVLAGGLA